MGSGVLTTADRQLAEGKDVAAVCRELEVSEPTYPRWRNQFDMRVRWRCRRAAQEMTS